MITMMSLTGSGDEVLIWTGQIMEAILWGAAALAGAEPGLAAALSISASLLGSSLGQSNQAQQLMSYLDLSALIDAHYGSLQTANGIWQNQIVGDAIKASMVYWMSQVAWQWPSTAEATMAAATQSANRIMFYATLLPTKYAIYFGDFSFWVKSPPSDNYLLNDGVQYSLGTLTALVQPGFPPEAMIADLWSTGVLRLNVYLGEGPWSTIARYHQEGSGNGGE